jgi:CRISPR-associated protein Cmr2
MAHVLIVWLGPVQDFIASARRCRDLWFGSWLLSELAKATALAFAERCGEESLVFPGIENRNSLRKGGDTSVANKIVVRVPAGMDPAELAETVGRPALQARLREIRDTAFNRVTEPAGAEYFERTPAEAQVDDLIEYAWAAVEEGEGETGYADARSAAEALLTARRATSLWGPVTWGAEVPKSSIDGARESVLHEDLYDEVRRSLSADDLYRAYGVGPTERLCGVGLLKRHGRRTRSRYDHQFLSTGHLAAWPLLERMAALAGAPGPLLSAWAIYLRKLVDLGASLDDSRVPRDREHEHKVLGQYDGSLLYESRVAELFEAITDPAERSRLATEARCALGQVLAAAGVTTPLPYYAILVADGDRMGQAIDRQQTPGDHRRLSQALAGFAREVRELVEEKAGGELVYAGGDDVLAFVPLHRAVECARDLADTFRERLAGFAAADGQAPTLSAGIGISHFLEPLSQALDVARRAESLAKSQPGRDSLAVVVDKRSGTRTWLAGRWGDLDRELEEYARLHAGDLLPDGAGFELRELGRLLEGTEGADRELLLELVRKEAGRILLRKRPEHGAKEGIEELDRLVERMERQTPGELGNRLIVARLLAEARLQAEPPKVEVAA